MSTKSLECRIVAMLFELCERRQVKNAEPQVD